MSLHSLLNQPITIQSMQAGTPDPYGNKPIVENGAPVATLGFIEQSTTSEDLLNRDTTKTNWEAWLPAGTAIAHLDYINFNGQKFQVDGEPWSVWHPGKRTVSHIVVKLVVING